MKKTKAPIHYDYYVHSISEDGTNAYKAIIPAFEDAVVYGDTLEELEEGVRFTISSEILERKKKKALVPEPEKSTQFNGKILIRISPFLHEQIALEAKAEGKSVNKLIEQRLIKD